MTIVEDVRAAGVPAVGTLDDAAAVYAAVTGLYAPSMAGRALGPRSRAIFFVTACDEDGYLLGYLRIQESHSPWSSESGEVHVSDFAEAAVIRFKALRLDSAIRNVVGQ